MSGCEKGVQEHLGFGFMDYVRICGAFIGIIKAFQRALPTKVDDQRIKNTWKMKWKLGVYRACNSELVGCLKIMVPVWYTGKPIPLHD